jgi:hypothetical protein
MHLPHCTGYIYNEERYIIIINANIMTEKRNCTVPNAVFMSVYALVRL